MSTPTIVTDEKTAAAIAGERLRRLKRRVLVGGPYDGRVVQGSAHTTVVQLQRGGGSYHLDTLTGNFHFREPS